MRSTVVHTLVICLLPLVTSSKPTVQTFPTHSQQVKGWQCSCQCTVEQQVCKIKQLVRSGEGQALQSYVESIEDFRAVWNVIDRHIIYEIIRTEPLADHMVQKWPVDIIGSLFFNAMVNDNLFEDLKTRLPTSLQMAANKYCIFTTTTTTTNTSVPGETSHTTTATSVPATTTTTATALPADTTAITTTTSDTPIPVSTTTTTKPKQRVL